MIEAAAPSVRRNFNALVYDVSFFTLGVAFIDNATVLPALVRSLGGGEATLGALLALRQAALYLPPLLIGHRLQGCRRYLPVVLKVAVTSRFFLLPAAVAVWQLGARQPGLALSLFSLAYLLSWAGDGAGVVPWTAMIGKVIPTERRGRLFAIVQALSSVGRLGAGLLVTPLLARAWLPFPANLGALVGVAFVALLVSGAALASVREPESAQDFPAADRDPFVVYLRRLPGLLRRNPSLLRLASAQVLGLSTAAVMPFIAHHSRSLDTTPPAALQGLLTRIGAEGQEGLFLLAMTAGQLVSAPLWGRLTDRYGPRLTLSTLYGVGFFAPIAALVGLLWGGGLTLYLAAYFLFGAVIDAWSTMTNYLLEVVHQSDESETDAIALMNVASLPTVLLPLIASRLPLPVACVGAAILVAAALLLARGLPNTRAHA